jgi:hypothetical protein
MMSLISVMMKKARRKEMKIAMKVKVAVMKRMKMMMMVMMIVQMKKIVTVALSHLNNPKRENHQQRAMEKY